MRLLLAALLFLPVAAAPAEGPAFVFRDVTAESGLLPDVSGIRGHAAGWGDVDGDGWKALYVATFHNEGSKPNQLFRNRKGKFERDGQEALRISTRATASLFADFDNDGDLDLYVTSMPTVMDGKTIVPCTLFRNDGGGTFSDVSKGNGACPADLAGRSAAVLDFDGDGLLDLLVGDDPFPGYKGRKSSRLFRNKGGLQFEDASEAAGLPAGIPGLGVAAGDVNNDGWPDFFVSSKDGGNRLFLNDGKGKFREAPGTREVFAWKYGEGDDTTAGVCIADVNRDGLLDIVIGHHFKRPWLKPVSVRLYLNRGIKDGVPTFEDVTEAAGLVALSIKAPHVEIQDFDNDGWPDLYVSIVKFADGKPYPVIFKNLGVEGGIPRFRTDALGVNDFPTAEDQAIKNTAKLFEKVARERKVMYSAPGPSADYDNDGKLDLFLASWWLESPSVLLRNETPGGHWLQVDLDCKGKVNRQGIGARINVLRGDLLLGSREVQSGYGYASGQPATAHFGLGKEELVDLEIVLPHGGAKIVKKGVKADQLIRVSP